MLTREQIIQRLKMLKPYRLAESPSAHEPGHSTFGMEPDGGGDYYRRDDVITIIKAAESE